MGTNTISLEQNGCVLREQYATPNGYTGQSLNLYDATRQVWHQTWVDNTGVLLTLEGGWQDSAMVLRGEAAGPTGGRAPSRVTWTPRSDGSVRQHWEVQASDGAWQTIFDGRYVRQ